MPCYHPLLGVPEYRSAEGKWCYVPRGKYDREIASTWTWLSEENKDGDRPQPVKIPCGRCIGCRLDYSRSWADRMMLELETSKKAVFLTLTYNNEHLPPCYDEDDNITHSTLYKRDLQLFFKRLRKMYPENKIRFYASGEYGSFENTGRPHYHSVVFGLGFEDFPEKHVHFLGKNELGQPYYRVDEIERAWSVYSRKAVPGKRVKFLKNKYEKVLEPIGFVCVAEVNWQTCAYVSRYVQKKVFHSHQAFIDLYGIEPEFSLMSRRPGIAGDYLEQHPEVFDYSIVPQTVSPQEITVPHYFLKKLSLTDPERYDSILSERRKFSDDKLLLQLMQTDLSYEVMLEQQEEEKLLRTSTLIRKL